MAQSSYALAFPTWRDLWASMNGVPSLLVKADAFLQRRAFGNRQMPYRKHSDNGEQLTHGIRALRAWANGNPPADVAERSEIARRIYEIVQPALHAAVWPRWLLLERAFIDGSATGDLPFAALALRAMCEEAQRLHALDLNADRVASMAASTATADQERFKLFLSIAWVSLDTLPQDMVLQGGELAIS
jgi:hypothetical protein